MTEKCSECGQDLPEPTAESLRLEVGRLKERVRDLEARPATTILPVVGAPPPTVLPAQPDPYPGWPGTTITWCKPPKTWSWRPE